ncbi:MAG: hypothetical protein ACLGHL_11265, partial [Actinomycetota bacterium]
SQDRLSQMLHRETEHISAAPLSSRSRRRIRVRQGFLLTGIAASIVALTMVAMSFASGPLKNEVAGEKKDARMVEETVEADGPNLVEIVTPAGSGEIWGRNFEINRHTFNGQKSGTCYELRVEGFEPTDCIALEKAGQGVSAGGGVIKGWGRAFVILDSPIEMDVGINSQRAAHMWVSEPPFEDRGLSLVVFNGARAFGAITTPADFNAGQLMVDLIGSFEVGPNGFRRSSSGSGDVGVTISIVDPPFGTVLQCPRLLHANDMGAARQAVEEWAEFVQPKEATGFSDISLGEAPAEASGCPDWVAERSLTASFSWQGGPFDDSASLSQVRVLVGKTLDGEWEVWRQEH